MYSIRLVNIFIVNNISNKYFYVSYKPVVFLIFFIFYPFIFFVFLHFKFSAFSFGTLRVLASVVRKIFVAIVEIQASQRAYQLFTLEHDFLTRNVRSVTVKVHEEV